MNPQQEIPQVEQTQSNSNLIISNPIKQNNTLVIILSILLLISISVSGYFAYQTQTLIKELTVLKNTTSTSIVTTERGKLLTGSDVAMGTENWRTYTNEKMKLSLKYPTDNGINVISSSYDDSNFSINTEKYAPLFLDVALLSNTKLEEWYVMAYGEAQQETPMPPTLENGPKISELSSKISQFNIQGYDNPVLVTFVQKGSDLYQVVMPTSNNQIQKQILSTFKFTDLNTTADWKTYTNTKYGYSFNYPSDWNLRLFPGSSEELNYAKSFVLTGPYTDLKTLQGDPMYTIKVEISGSRFDATTAEQISKSIALNNIFLRFDMSLYNPTGDYLDPKVLDQIVSSFKIIN